MIQSVIFRTIAGMARSYHGNVIYIDGNYITVIATHKPDENP